MSQSRHRAALTLPPPGGRLRAMVEGAGAGRTSNRDQRRAAALRANLRKRKAQQRARRDSVSPSSEPESPAPESSAPARLGRDPAGAGDDEAD